ncbi:MAG: alpha/beta hydrolase [Clostridia bacterium]|nr:alpha/beta hydrolase [Clostridia bacterium]
MKQMNLWENIPGMCEEVPVIEYYPAENKKTDATIVILPGGGYTHRAQHEGKGFAEFLNEFGMDTFVCHYRVSPHRHPLPVLDARRAVQFVRYHANEFGINPEKVGIMGSSAGGHLAASVCTLQDEFDDVLTEKDAIDNENYIPDFQILCYPVIALVDYGHMGSAENLTGDKNKYAKKRYELSCHNNVHEKTPKAFIWHTITDPAVPIQNSLAYVGALREKEIPAELHVFPYGGHGMGVAAKEPHIAQWTTLLKNWLILNELLGE